jgi:hypothetical protein
MTLAETALQCAIPSRDRLQKSNNLAAERTGVSV